MLFYNLNCDFKRGYRKSWAESYLIDLIKKQFPNLLLSENDRKTLPSKLEIDILIPQINLAIELNGPVHYFPIYGTNKLTITQNKDEIKEKEIKEMGLNFLVIDISMLKSRKKTKEFILRVFENKIKNTIQNLL